MKIQENKTIEFLYQEMEAHFLANPNVKDVMINATEMAKIFDKRVDVFMKTDNTKAFISALKLTGNSVSLKSNQPPNGGRIIDSRRRNGIYFNEILALKFASWLDPNFEIWVYKTIRDILTKETKIVKIAVNDLSAKEIALKKIVSTIQQSENKDAKDLLNALSEFEEAKKKKTKAVTLFSKQMSMDL